MEDDQKGNIVQQTLINLLVDQNSFTKIVFKQLNVKNELEAIIERQPIQKLLLELEMQEIFVILEVDLLQPQLEIMQQHDYKIINDPLELLIRNGDKMENTLLELECLLDLHVLLGKFAIYTIMVEYIK